MKALITGGAGFIGFHLSKFLINNNFKVDLLDNFYRGKYDEELNILSNNPDINIIKADLLDNEIDNKLDVDYDFIFHFAAILGVENVIGQPYNVLDLNTRLTLNAINIAKKQKALNYFIFSSTSEVYAGSLLNGLLTIPTKENSVIALPEIRKPRSSYMLSKIYGEALCSHSSISYMIIRPHNIYGPRMGMAHVIPQLMEKSYHQKNNGTLEVFSLNHTRTFCYVMDAIQQIYSLILNKNSQDLVFNIGCQDPEITIKDLSSKIIKLSGKNMTIKALDNSEGSPERRCPNMEKTIELTKYRNQISIDEGLILTYDWYLKNYFKK